MKKIILTISMCFVAILCFSFVFTFGRDNDITSNGGNNISVNVDFSQLTYASFGDSITFGADYTRSYEQMDNPYPKLVGQYLGLKSTSNFGISGSTLCSNNLGLTCMTDTILSNNTKFDIISVMGGVNDYNRNLPLGTISDNTKTTIYGALNVIANNLKTKFPNSFVFFMTPYQEYWNNHSCFINCANGYNLEDVANAVMEVASNHNIPVLDMFNTGNYEDIEMNDANSDHLHPSQSFIAKYTAPQITRFLRDSYKQK